MKKALTIGELLITMAIIGTIATLVLPGFLKDYHKKLYVTRLKKTVEIVENAINQACIDNNVSYFYQTPYVNNLNTFAEKYFKKSNNSTSNPFSDKYTHLNGTEFNAPEDGTNIQLVSGEAININCTQYPTAGICNIYIDINSKDGPNIAGRDYFQVYTQPLYNNIFDPAPGNIACPSSKGLGCYAQLLQDNWEMKY